MGRLGEMDGRTTGATIHLIQGSREMRKSALFSCKPLTVGHYVCEKLTEAFIQHNAAPLKHL